jgi:4-diphosphocytidyl-2-C-methyl-D-erythritol kinase
MRLRALAPAKVNVALFLGGLRPDGRHELVTLFESVSLADELTMGPGASNDAVNCPGVEGPNLAELALGALRSRGWDAPPVALEVRKRIPVAGGMAGGSADAAATLRMAAELAPVAAGELERIAAALGADVPSQLQPGLSVGTGAGDVVQRSGPLAPHAFLILPQPFGLPTAEVYREADRLGLPRSAEDLAIKHGGLLDALGLGAELPPELLVNDLEPAALSLRPEIEGALQAVRATGAEQAMVCGSGPTVVGLFRGRDGGARAAAAADALAARYPEALAAIPVSAAFAIPQSA